jgi:hypothetical protein
MGIGVVCDGWMGERVCREVRRRGRAELTGIILETGFDPAESESGAW